MSTRTLQAKVSKCKDLCNDYRFKGLCLHQRMIYKDTKNHRCSPQWVSTGKKRMNAERLVPHYCAKTKNMRRFVKVKAVPVTIHQSVGFWWSPADVPTCVSH